MSSTDLPISRARLSRVIRDAGDVVQTDRVAQLLEVGHTDASKLLARWAAQGWLKRVGPGVYLPVTIDALGSDRVLADPWILVPVLFAPGYISGWSAAEHWDLTEQIFNDIVVKTCRPLRSRTRKVHGVSFVLRHIKEEHLFGTKTRWRGQTRVRVADIHRCLVDMLDDQTESIGQVTASAVFFPRPTHTALLSLPPCGVSCMLPLFCCCAILAAP